MGKLISCLCVSQPSRWGFLQRAILDYRRQTYADRELVVAVNSPQYADQIRAFVAAQAVPAPVAVIRRDQREQAALLLHAQAAAHGALLAVWDDDNQNDPDRLALVSDFAADHPDAAFVCGQVAYHFLDTREVFFVDLEQPAAPLSKRAAATSLVVPRRHAPVWAFAGKTNSAVAAAADRLGVPVMVVNEPAFAHLVGVRGDNIRGEVYHRNLATGSPLAKTADWLRGYHKSDVERWLGQYLWDAGALAVSGPDGVAFEHYPQTLWPRTLYPIGGPDDGVVRTTEHLG